jgi:small subunit ribosomal protein S1
VSGSQAEGSTGPASFADLKIGMELHGTVRAVEPVGVIVDVGLGHGGLVHISEYRGRGQQRELPTAGDAVTVWVRNLDAEKHRLSLTMVAPPKFRLADLTPDMVVPGKVVRVAKFGAFVDIGADREGLVHVSEMAEGFVRDPSAIVSPGAEVQVRVLGVDLEKGQVRLSMKQAAPPPEPQPEPEPLLQEYAVADMAEPTAFELALLAARDKTAGRQQRNRQRRERVRPEHDEDDIFARTIRYHQEQAKK